MKTSFVLPALTLVLSFGLLSCHSNKKENKSEATEEEAELTYREMVILVFEDYSKRIEWHGEEAAVEGKEDLEIIKSEESCGEGDCGVKYYLQNNGTEQRIEAIVKAPYSIEGETSYVAMQYTVASGERVYIGCSHLCYKGETLEFTREIVGAKIIE
ncbi:MAG: hypothetical protein AAFX87_07265 [Bacteroidota bacterium]